MPDTLVSSPPDPPATRIVSGQCAACESTLEGSFCATCGERAPTPDDESLAVFLRDQFHEVTSADGRLWRTIRALFVPGKLTAEYFAGRRSLYVRPVRIFLVVNIVFFFWITFMGGQAFRGDAALYRSKPQNAALMSRGATEAGVPDEVYDAAFGQHAESLAPTMIALTIPMFALVFALVLAPARRPFVRHIVFSTHFVAVFMASTILIGGALYLLSVGWAAVTSRPPFIVDDSVIVPMLLAAWTVYLVVGVRRVYDVPRWGAALSGLLVATLGTFGVMMLYQLILFYATLWTVDVPA